VTLPTFSPFVPSALVERTKVAVDHVQFRVAATEEMLTAFTRAGQFVKIRVRAEDERVHEGIFAIAAAPFERRLFFLARTNNPEGGEAADRIARMAIGAPLEVTLPAGEGFALERARGHDLAFVAVGTALAPVRSALEVVLKERTAYGALSLDYGLRTRARLPFASDVDRWKAFGVKVTLHVSERRPDGSFSGVRAQDAALKRIGKRTAHTAIVAVGHPELVRDVRERHLAAGGDPALVLHNY
jgi:NAD(P)H-flavin reductase